MRRRSRPRRALKWTGLATCALVLVVWIGTTLCQISYVTDSCAIHGSHGRLYYNKFLGTLEHRAHYVKNQRGGGSWVLNYMGTDLYERPLPDALFNLGFGRPYRSRTGPHWIGTARITSLDHVLPLWVPLLVIALPTAFFWRLDRRHILPGHCQRCGYDLAGNVSGRCPECGTDVPARQAD